MNDHITQLRAASEAKNTETPLQMKYCLYARKSTESEERQVLSIDSQIKEMLQIAERDGVVPKIRQHLYFLTIMLALRAQTNRRAKLRDEME